MFVDRSGMVGGFMRVVWSGVRSCGGLSDLQEYPMVIGTIIFDYAHQPAPLLTSPPPPMQYWKQRSIVSSRLRFRNSLSQNYVHGGSISNPPS